MSPLLAVLAVSLSTADAGTHTILSVADDCPQRQWLAPHLWGNRLQDWRLADGRLECVTASRRLPYRTVHTLAHRLEGDGSAEFTVRLGFIDQAGTRASDAAAGLLLGVGNGAMDYRSAALVQMNPGNGGGVLVAVDAAGMLFMQDHETGKRFRFEQPAVSADALAAGGTLTVKVTPEGNHVNLWASFDDGKAPSPRIRHKLPAERLHGGVALVSHPGSPGQGTKLARAWFDDWTASGARVVVDPSRTFGPIAGTMYTVSDDTLKLTAQLFPVATDAAEAGSATLFLGVDSTGQPHRSIEPPQFWRSMGPAAVSVPSCTAAFRTDQWNRWTDAPSDGPVHYKVVHEAILPDSETETFEWHGSVPVDPVAKEEIVVAALSCNHMVSHGFGNKGFDYRNLIYMPHQEVVDAVEHFEPDLLFFAGDQIYEGASPTFPDRSTIMDDYLYKWLLFVWSFRDAMAVAPTLTIPDDHDVYQGNLWGEGGRKAPGRDHTGGYVHPPEFVRMVERTQTSHLPDPADDRTLPIGTKSYYTDFVLGGIGIAVMEDRKFKSGCDRPGMPPSGTGRPDHFNDPDFDVARLDLPGLSLLGDEQLAWLDRWGRDWTGQKMKLALSQTIFANMATHHGPKLEYLIADLDSNGWPQTGRDRAVDALRRAFAFHVAGDQHLSTVVHHGIDTHDDAIWSFCVPATANFYPRAWRPEAKPLSKPPGASDFLGKHFDGFRNPVDVIAVANPGAASGRKPEVLYDRGAGYGIVRMNKKDRTATFESWPRQADPANPGEMFPGWPVTVPMTDNRFGATTGKLPTLVVPGMTDPVVQVIDESDGSVAYTLRIVGTEFTPQVDGAGPYTVRFAADGRTREKTGLTPATEGEKVVVGD